MSASDRFCKLARDGCGPDIYRPGNLATQLVTIKPRLGYINWGKSQRFPKSDCYFNKIPEFLTGCHKKQEWFFSNIKHVYL